MAYSRREVQDHVTIMNKDLYDNLQDGVEEAKEEVVKKNKEANLYTDEKVAEVNQYIDSKVSEVNTKAETATSIAKGRNKAKVFSTTEDMQIWLSTEENKGLCNIGDNLYIVDTEVPDWWIAEVLNSVDEETGYYYKIALLETQKVDLSSYDEKLRNLEEDVEQQNEKIVDVQNDMGGLRFGIDGEGNYGYFGADDSLIPFKKAPTEILEYKVGISSNSTSSLTYTATEDCYVVICGTSSSNSTSTSMILRASINGTYVFNTEKTTDSWQNNLSATHYYIGQLKTGDVVSCTVRTQNASGSYQSNGTIAIIAFK